MDTHDSEGRRNNETDGVEYITESEERKIRVMAFLTRGSSEAVTYKMSNSSHDACKNVVSFWKC